MHTGSHHFSAFQHDDSSSDFESCHFRPLGSDDDGCSDPGQDDSSQADSLNAESSLLLQAQAIFDGCDKRRLLVEAMVLADLSPDNIAAATGLHPEAINAFESHFFDYRHCREATDWIVFQAIMPCDYVKSVPQSHGVLLKRLGFFRGPLMLEQAKPYLLDGKPLFEGVLDASTPEGRSRLLVELALAAELLPEHGRGQHSPLLSVQGFLQEMDSRRSSRAVPLGELADNARAQIEEWSKGLIWSCSDSPRRS